MAKAICSVTGTKLQDFYNFCGTDGSEIVDPHAIGVERHRSFHIQEVITYGLSHGYMIVELQTKIELCGKPINNCIHEKHYKENILLPPYKTIYTGLTINNIPHMTVDVSELHRIDGYLLCFVLD
jgi:hypothetical protein